MNKKQIEKVARQIAADYSRTPFDEMTMVIKTLFLFVSAWHIKNTPKKKKARRVNFDDFCTDNDDKCKCNGATCVYCEKVFNATVKFIKEQEEKCTKQ